MKTTTLIFCTLILLFWGCTENKKNTLFVKVEDSDSNVIFSNKLKDDPSFNVMKYGYFYNGGGVATADFNNDGFQDLYFTGNLMHDHLYLNKGNGKIEFENITRTAGIGNEQGWNTGVSVVDINNDGWVDIYVCRSAAASSERRKNLLYINNHDNTFTESASKYGLDDSGFSTQAVFFDYDKDGDLDCFVLNHSVQKYAGFSQNLKNLKKQKDPKYTSRLYRNENNKFENVSDEAGLISNVLSFGLSAMLSDYNNDGWLDLYISNDFNEEDYLYLNQQNGSFKESIRQSMPYTSLFSMGADAADINNDGKIDLYTLDMLPESNSRMKMTAGDDNYLKYQNLLKNGFHRQTMRNMLQLNAGNKNEVPLFSEIGQMAGVSNTDWSWSALIADYDLDGKKDIFVTNGYEKDYTNMDFLAYTVDLQGKAKQNRGEIKQLDIINEMPAIHSHNYLFKNIEPYSFKDVSNHWGLGESVVSSGAIYVDLDNDGDYDLVTNNVNQEVSIYKNQTSNNSIKITPKASQSLLIGAKVTVYQGELQQTLEYIPTRGFQSSMQQPLIFSKKAEENIDSIMVRWSDGNIQNIHGLSSSELTIEYKKTGKNYSFKKKKKTNFELVKTNLVSEEEARNDFDNQALLPFMETHSTGKLSSNKNYLYQTGTSTQNGKLYKHKNGEWSRIKIPNHEKNLVESDAVLFDIDNDNDLDLIISFNGFYNTKKANSLVFYENKGNDKFKLQENYFEELEIYSSGALEVLDYNQDGFFDLFIAGGVLETNYPMADKSTLLTNEKGKLLLKNKNHQQQLGLVREVKSSFFDTEFPDLVLAVEWGTISIVKNEKGNISLKNNKDISPKGFWQTISLNDVDNDGDIDIVAGNIGINNQLSKLSESGLKLYPIMDANDKIVPIITFFQNEKEYPFAARDEILAAFPALKKQFTNYESYANATIKDVFLNQEIEKNVLEVENYRSMVFYNDSNEWKNEPLPIQAQNSIVKSIQYLDLDDDNENELFLFGNETNSRVRIGDLNSNLGLIFKRDKNGDFMVFNNLALNKVVNSSVVLESGEMLLSVQNDSVYMISSNFFNN